MKSFKLLVAVSVGIDSCGGSACQKTPPECCNIDKGATYVLDNIVIHTDSQRTNIWRSEKTNENGIPCTFRTNPESDAITPIAMYELIDDPPLPDNKLAIKITGKPNEIKLTPDMTKGELVLAPAPDEIPATKNSPDPVSPASGPPAAIEGLFKSAKTAVSGVVGYAATPITAVTGAVNWLRGNNADQNAEASVKQNIH